MTSTFGTLRANMLQSMSGWFNQSLPMIRTFLFLTTAGTCSLHASGPDIQFLFSHGWKDDRHQGKFYHPEHRDAPRPCVIVTPCVAPNYPDSIDLSRSILPQLLRLRHTSLGQENEIEVLDAAYERCHQASPHSGIVLFGVSRGAATAATFTAAKQPANLRALVLESPFDSVESLLAKQIDAYVCEPVARLCKKVMPLMIRQRLDYMLGERAAREKQRFLRLTSWLVPWLFLHYRADGPSPLKAAEAIPRDLPMLLIANRDDRSVPVETTRSLYRRLIETDHTNIHLLILPTGKHARIARESPEGQLFQRVVHAFYRAYDLPHDPAWAAAGHEEFLRTKEE